MGDTLHSLIQHIHVHVHNNGLHHYNTHANVNTTLCVEAMDEGGGIMQPTLMN